MPLLLPRTSVLIGGLLHELEVVLTRPKDAPEPDEGVLLAVHLTRYVSFGFGLYLSVLVCCQSLASALRWSLDLRTPKFFAGIVITEAEWTPAMQIPADRPPALQISAHVSSPHAHAKKHAVE